MSKFKQTVRFRVIRSILSAVVAIAVFFIIYFITGGTSVTGGKGQIDDFVQGFDVGIFSAVVGVSIFYAVSNILALRSEEKLKKLYIRETDERKTLIAQKSGSTATNITLQLNPCNHRVGIFQQDYLPHFAGRSGLLRNHLAQHHFLL